MALPTFKQALRFASGIGASLLFMQLEKSTYGMTRESGMKSSDMINDWLKERIGFEVPFLYELLTIGVVVGGMVAGTQTFDARFGKDAARGAYGRMGGGFQHKQAAYKTAVVVLVNGTDDAGQVMYAYVAVKLSKLESFLRAFAKGGCEPERFGVVLTHGMGEQPDPETQARMEREYGVKAGISAPIPLERFKPEAA